MPPSRPLALLLSMGLVAVSVRAGEEDGRAERVFQRVQAAVHAPLTPHLNTGDLQRTPLVRETVPESGRPITMPILPPGCGLGVFGGLDVEGTVALAVDLFALQGFELQPGHVAAGVRLDGLDPKAKVGILIHRADVSSGRMPVPEGTTDDLRALEDAGYRVLILPAGRFRCMQSDTSTPLHAAAVSIVEFLADVAGTPPADLSVLAGGQATGVEAAGLEHGIEGATTFHRSDTGVFVVLDEVATVTLRVVPPPEIAGRDRPALVTLPFTWVPPWTREGDLDFDAEPPTFVLVQSGSPPLRSGRAVFLTDGAFDPAKPFRILITLRPGQTHLGTTVRVRTSTGSSR